MGRVLAIFALVLFSLIGVLALMKKKETQNQQVVTLIPTEQAVPIDLELDEEPVEIEPAPNKGEDEPKPEASSYPLSAESLPTANRIDELFVPSDLQSFPFIKTITYKSKVPWLEGRPAWISDYATHFKTSRHFIGRSLHGKGQYYKQEVSNGQRFNILDPERETEFYLLVDLSTAKLWLYAYDVPSHKKWLIKDYTVGLGRQDPLKSSGLLTPKGKYLLGDRIAAYTPKSMGPFNGDKVPLITVFGTRWIPFEKEIAGTTAPARGLGLHGAPWVTNSEGVLEENKESIGTYTSDGCVRMRSDDIEEIYALIATKPTYIELVSHFTDGKIPGDD